MNAVKREQGFTLVEVMMVVVILVVLAAVATPKYTASGNSARQNVDIATAHEVMTALDRYQVETGLYPKMSEMTAAAGAITASKFIPAYISKLDSNTTQQRAEESKRGFGIAELSPTGLASPPTNLIMLYITTNGSGAEVRVYDENLTTVLWSSLD